MFATASPASKGPAASSAALARFSAPFEVFGTAAEYVRVGDQGAKFIFRFCPVCGTSVFHTEDGDNESVSVAVGAFADPNFPAPQVSVYDSRRHPWVQLPPGTRTVRQRPHLITASDHTAQESVVQLEQLRMSTLIF